MSNIIPFPGCEVPEMETDTEAADEVSTLFHEDNDTTMLAVLACLFGSASALYT